MTSKTYKIDGSKIKQLIEPMGGCMATDKITVNGDHVDFMYRVEPDFQHDSGWRFMSGTEDEEYVNDSDNWAIYDVNTIANYDAAIIAYLNLPNGSELERVRGTNKFELVK